MTGRTKASQPLSPTEAAELIGVPVRTLERWRYVGRGPAYYRVGKHVRYLPADIDRWLKQRRRSA